MAERTELNTLNHLLETCRDGARGFEFAAQHAVDPDIRDLFTTLADERARFAEELTPHVHRLGGQGYGTGTVAGAIHRGWMSLADRVSGHHDEGLLREADRGERAATHAYEEALHGMLPPTASELVECQLGAIREAHARMVAMARVRELVL